MGNLYFNFVFLVIMNNIDKCFNSDGVLVTPPNYIGTVVFPDLEFNILDDSLVMATLRDPTNASSYLNNISIRDVHNISADDEFQFETCRMRGIDSLSDSLNYSAFLADKLGSIKSSIDKLAPSNNSSTQASPDPTSTHNV